MLEVHGVSKTYGVGDDRISTIKALDDISLTVPDGEFVSVIGPTGCGKSTLFEIIGGLLKPSTGEVVLDDNRVNGPDERIGMVFQSQSSFPWLSVIENVAFGLRMNGVGKAERRERAKEMIDLVGLSGFEDANPRELSGGMNQRVAIARTLVMKPDIVLMDEPFGALDEQTRLILGEELLRIWRETGATILLVTHNINEAVQLSDRIAVMSARPGTFKSVVENRLERPRDADARSREDFSKIVTELWDLLKTESEKGLDQQSRTVDSTDD